MIPFWEAEFPIMEKCAINGRERHRIFELMSSNKEL